MRQETVYLFVLNALTDWEIGFAIAGINSPVFQKQPGRYRIQTVGLSADPVITLGGLTILPDATLSNLDASASALLILPGSERWDAGKNVEILALAKAFLIANIPVAAICGATTGLAYAGMLNDKSHTSNSLDYLQATNYKGAAYYRNRPAVTDGNVITAGGTAPIEFAYHIFKALDLYDTEVLEAQYRLFKTGDTAYYSKLQKLSTLSAA